MAGSVAKNAIGRLHFEQIRTGGLFFAAQIIAKLSTGIGDNRRPQHEVHLGATTGLYRNLARSLATKGRFASASTQSAPA